MIPTRRIVAALGLAAGVTGLAAPLANAADASAPATGQISPMAVLDSLTVSDIPAQYKAGVPRVSEQTRALNQINELDRLGELWQVAGLVAPVTGLLPAVEA
ncbi:hypothetical protein GT045_06535 [Streptomyces sp. SID486]|uniref:hypothetical protein n=1 Tax=unclassified Streptomyces TaxID=2593676 RepID=UPI001371CF14|nr:MULTISPECIES: hypothetical protein [unclassified Streptomyces]MYW41880.1 hypothetical protein [Streptomyces sp. SID161]MYX94474.1 hypothetical protein [Streptomyces sp. SID486]